jgi:hypothetical protein
MPCKPFTNWVRYKEYDGSYGYKVVDTVVTTISKTKTKLSTLCMEDKDEDKLFDDYWSSLQAQEELDRLEVEMALKTSQKQDFCEDRKPAAQSSSNLAESKQTSTFNSEIERRCTNTTLRVMFGMETENQNVSDGAN